MSGRPGATKGALGERRTGRPRESEVVPVRHPWRWVTALVILVLAAQLIYSAATNPRFRWDLVGEFLFDHRVIDGLGLTLNLTAVSMLIAVALGIVLAIMRMSPNPILRGASWIYVWFFRGTPLLVQLLFWFFMAAVYPTVGIGIPFGPTFADVSTTAVISQYGAAILGLGLNEAAYMAEIVRGGILSVDAGQTDAAHAVGMTRMQTLRRIVLPQAMRVIVPPTGNEVISMLKTTSLVFAIALPELLTSVQIIYAQNFQQVPLLIVACFWYLLFTSALTAVQYVIERRLARGQARHVATTPWLRRLLGTGGARESVP